MRFAGQKRNRKGQYTFDSSYKNEGKIKQIIANEDGTVTFTYEESPKTNISSKRVDKNGVPFKYDTIYLDPKEYKNVVDEIGRWYPKKYVGKAFCHCDFTDKTYYFENRGIGDYNIYEVIEW